MDRKYFSNFSRKRLSSSPESQECSGVVEDRLAFRCELPSHRTDFRASHSGIPDETGVRAEAVPIHADEEFSIIGSTKNSCRLVQNGRSV
jgi:hypothetical protein